MFTNYEVELKESSDVKIPKSESFDDLMSRLQKEASKETKNQFKKQLNEKLKEEDEKKSIRRKMKIYFLEIYTAERISNPSFSIFVNEIRKKIDMRLQQFNLNFIRVDLKEDELKKLKKDK